MSGYPPKTDKAYQTGAPIAGTNSTQNLNASANGKFDFKNAPRFPDLWATVLFIVHFIAFIILSGVGGNALRKDVPANNGSTTGGTVDAPEMPNNIKSGLITVLVLFTLGAGALSGIYVALMRRFPKQLIVGTFWLSIGLNVALGLLLLISGAVLPGVISLVFAGLFALAYFWWRSRIPFAAALLSAVVDIGNKYPASYMFAFMSAVLGCVHSIWWVSTMVGCLIAYQNDTSVGPTIINAFLILSFYWTAQVISNTLHVTISGTVASYYFLEGTSAMPQNPSLSAAKRAFTTSFGPIAFGSLIVALVEFIKHQLEQASREGSIVACIFACIFSCIQGIIEYLNFYAYIQVAMYGKPFCDAAKDTWALMKSTGFSAIMNDNFIGNVIGIGALLVGLLAGGLGFLGLKLAFTKAEQDMWGGYMFGVALILFFVGCLMISIVGMYIRSAVSTLFVCLAEDPAALARTKPQLYESIRQTYPQIAWRV
eukprot:Partr_v1_DN28724_c1_g1_i1_m61713 putative Probably involved in transport through the plasma membrane (By similarity)